MVEAHTKVSCRYSAVSADPACVSSVYIRVVIVTSHYPTRPETSVCVCVCGGGGGGGGGGGD